MKSLTRLPGKMPAGFGLSMIDRAVKEKMLGTRCKASDLKPVLDYFQQDGVVQCFYCDAPDPRRWDHLHPVSRGGDTMPGNLVPACPRCDDSKQDRDIEMWVASSSPHRPPPERLGVLLQKVEAYRKQFPYEAVEFSRRLSPSQLETYLQFRAEIDALRRHLEKFDMIKTKGATRARGAAPVQPRETT